MILGDLGADVLRVERPTPGLDVLDGNPDHMLRNRRSIIADLKSEVGLDSVRQLVCSADVLIEGYRPGVAERLGLGPLECQELNARLIYARMTGWGQDGPRSSQAGHDINYLSVTGALHAMGRRNEAPTPPLNLVGDFGGGSLFLVVGILAALVEREKSGLGQTVDAAIVDGVSVLSQMMWAMRGFNTWTDARESNLLDGGAPFYDTYECADGTFLAVGALEPEFFKALIGALNLDPGWCARQMDRSVWPSLRLVLTRVFAQHDRDHWTNLFSGTDACVTPVLTFAEAAEDPHLRSRGTLLEVGGVIQAAPAPRFSRSTTTTPSGPPEFNADARDLLKEWQ